MELNRGSSSSSSHDGPRSSGDPAENSPPSPVSVIASSHSQHCPSPPADDADSPNHPHDPTPTEIDGDTAPPCQPQHNHDSNDINNADDDDDDDDRPILETLNSRKKEIQDLQQQEQQQQEQQQTQEQEELPRQAVALTEASLTEQNKRMKKDEPDHPPNSIREWAATLPEIPDSAQQIPTGPSHIFEVPVQDEKQHDSPSPKPDEPQIQETKDIFTDTQKIAYIGLCAVTSLEVVHDFQGKEFTYARMSADNWQRKLMRMLYAHMDISGEGKRIY